MLMTRMLSGAQGLTYAQVVLQDGPVAFWPLNETSGTVAHDISPNGLNATIESGVTLGESGIPAGGGSFLFNGSSGYCNVPANSLLCPLSQGTIEAWVKPTSLSATGDWVSTGDNSGYRVRSEAGYPDIVYNDADQLKSTQVLSETAFQHVVITFGPSGSQIYQNGVLVVSGGAAYSQSAGTQALYIGANLTYREYFPGYLSNVAIYNTVLTPARIQAHYNAGIA